MMKSILTKTAILSLILCISMQVSFAQDEQKEYKTLFGTKNVHHGGYGALDIFYSKIDGRDAVLVGAHGGWIINHGLTIGLGGFGFVNDIYYEIGHEEYQLAGGYGGLFLEPIIFPKSPVHLSIPMLIGAGGAAFVYQTNFAPESQTWDTYDSQAFFVFEPGVDIEFNLVQFMRFAIGAKYRFTSNLTMEGATPKMLEGYSLGMSLKFGSF